MPVLSPAPPGIGAPVYTYAIAGVFPHDRNAWTQGLVFSDGILYEGTGREGESSLRRVELETGEVQQIVTLPKEYFGEGITVFGDRIFQLTLHARLGFVYDRLTFNLLETFRYPTEGWGLTHNGEHLIMSDGTSTLRFLQPDTQEEVKRIDVHDAGAPITWLNELEFVEGEIYANVWQSELIARIDPDTGLVTGWIELGGLLGPEDLGESVSVLNGIAYDADHRRLFVTGKLWPKLFEIQLVAQE
jgi:glutamine cyclotransferase